ncbi:alpha/beta hydrolase [Acinetobacter sp. NIPH 2699]|uniref:alpha/beta fold hydrolase n=1 Tax=Acinetobacter sp. NIPH 2699 TaxID=2923433 RepID=UPI001F4B4CCC|nr:alpha/beta hydrolase [Acinetobacter sp. NIPH 2699]MCH7336747.1 alpha/beta hydrolase [Acinetobacter sp. NIPH 2699]
MYHTLESWKKTGKYFTFKNFNIFYQYSSRPAVNTIFLIHGYPTSSFDWTRVWEQLSEEYQLVAIDLLGLGFSDKPVGHQYSVQDHADQCIALIQYLKLDNVHLVGHDLGVGVIQELLDRQLKKQLPHSIQSVVFMNGSLFSEAYRPRIIQKLMASFLGHLIVPLISFSVFSKSMLQMFDQHHQPTSSELEQWYKLLNYNYGKKSLVSLNRSIFTRFKYRDRLVNALIHNKVPMLLINGKNDPNSGEHMAVRYRELIPNPQVIEIDECGHWTPWEQPKIVAKEIMCFLANYS